MSITFEQIPEVLTQILDKITDLEQAFGKIQANYEGAPLLPENINELLTFTEALLFLKVTRSTLHRWKREGNIPYNKIGTKTYFKKSDLESYNKVQIKKPKGLR